MKWYQGLAYYRTADGRGAVTPNGHGGYDSEVRLGYGQTVGVIGSNLRTLDEAKQDVERVLGSVPPEIQQEQGK